MSGHLRQKHRRIRPRPPNPRCHHLPGSRDARPGWPAPDPALGGQDTPAPGGRIPRRNRRPKEGPVRRCPSRRVPHDARGPLAGFLERPRGILERGAAPPVEPGLARSGAVGDAAQPGYSRSGVVSNGWSRPSPGKPYRHADGRERFGYGRFGYPQTCPP